MEDLVWMDSDAMARSLDDNTVDGYKIAFGIHNVTHIDCALKEALADILYFNHVSCLMYELQGRLMALH